MRAITFVLVALFGLLTTGCEKTIKDVKSDRPRDAVAALEQWRERVLADASDEHLAGFVAVLGAVPDNEEVAAALRAEAALTRETADTYA